MQQFVLQDLMIGMFGKCWKRVLFFGSPNPKEQIQPVRFFVFAETWGHWGMCGRDGEDFHCPKPSTSLKSQQWSIVPNKNILRSIQTLLCKGSHIKITIISLRLKELCYQTIKLEWFPSEKLMLPTNLLHIIINYCIFYILKK